ncbi:MAG TPA: WD40 repeat domain-containing protein [Gemmataceae bacterium]|nr:WD40 repeat domain-containing protein [Gemmataceae bacterium]
MNWHAGISPPALVTRSPRRRGGRVLPALCLLTWLGAGWGLWLARTPVPRATTLRGISAQGEWRTWNRSGEVLATQSGTDPDNQTITLWDTDQGSSRCQIRGPLMWFMQLSPDGKFLATSTNERQFQLWEVATDEPRVCMQFWQSGPLRVWFSPDSKLLLKWEENDEFKLIELASKTVIATFDLPGRLIGFSPDGQDLIFERPDKSGLILVDWKTRAKQREIPIPLDFNPELVTPPTAPCAIAPDGQTLATGFDKDFVHLWTGTGQHRAVQDFGGHGGLIRNMAFSADSKLLAVSRWRDGSKYYRFRGILGGNLAEKFFPPEHITVLLDTATGRPLIQLPYSWVLIFRPDGKTLVTYSEEQDAIVIWDMPPHTRFNLAWGLPPTVPALLLSAAWWYRARRGRAPNPPKPEAT